MPTDKNPEIISKFIIYILYYNLQNQQHGGECEIC